MALQVGSILQNKYRIEELLGSGSIGQVFRGRHLALKKQVAIKVLLPEQAHRPDVLARFEREALVGAHVVHPNIAAASDLGQLDDGSYFLVLELIRGVTLRELIRQGPLDPRRAVVVGLGIARALQCLHAAGIVHRDLKPANVMLVDGNEAQTKLIDFGLAQIRGESELVSQLGDTASSAWDTITTEGQFLGTVAYVAPEVRHGMEAIGPSSDLYALGVLLFEMLAGRRPFVAQNPVEVLRLQLLHPPPPLSSLVEQPLPGDLPALVHELLAKEPEERPDTAQVVLRLDALASAFLPLSSRPLPPSSLILPGPDLGPPPSVPPLPDAAPTAPDPLPPSFSGREEVHYAEVPYEPRRRGRPTVLLLALLFASGLGLGTWLMRSPAAPTPAPSSSPSAPPPAAPLAPLASASASALLPTSLTAAAARGDWGAVQREWIALGATDPSVYRRAEVQEALGRAATELGRKAPTLLQGLCKHLAERPSGDGADALFELSHLAGGPALAFRVREGLDWSLARGTASERLRFNLGLMRAPCAQKTSWIQRAVAEGDGRTRRELEALRGSECVRPGGCCLKQLPQLAEVLERLPR
jgi:serine/threonine-protein kinase